METDLDFLRQKLSKYINIPQKQINKQIENPIHNIIGEDEETMEIKREIQNEIIIKNDIQIPVRCYSFSCLVDKEKYKHLENEECIILSNIDNIEFIKNSQYLELKIDYNEDTKLFLTEIDNLEKYILKVEDNIDDIENSIYIPDSLLNKLWLNQGDKIYISNVNMDDIKYIDTIILDTDNETIEKDEMINLIKDRYDNKLINLNDAYIEIENDYHLTIIDIIPKNDKYLLFNKDKIEIIMKEKKD